MDRQDSESVGRLTWRDALQQWSGGTPPPPRDHWEACKPCLGLRVSGPHPWLQYIVVTQCPGLAGEFALVSWGYTCVTWDPVHGPWEALEEVRPVVVGSTLLLTEGQCYRDKMGRLSLSLLPLAHTAFHLASQNFSWHDISLPHRLPGTDSSR